MMRFLYFLCFIIPIVISGSVDKRESPPTIGPKIINELPRLVKRLPPDLSGKRKGESAKICIFGGSLRHCGAPYITAISAYKVGADLVHVMTPNETAQCVKAYSSDQIVYPFFNLESITKAFPIIQRSDVIVVGPGMDAEEEAITLAYEVINKCKALQKPLIIDSDGLTALARNPTILKDYPAPVILTPNHMEAENLIKGMALTNDSKENWYDYWGSNVAVLHKGETDRFFTKKTIFNWESNEGGTWRRCPHQGNVLAGSLATFFNWALKNDAFASDKSDYPYLSQSVAAYAATKITRYSNSKAFEIYGRGLLASNMIDYIHLASNDIFNK